MSRSPPSGEVLQRGVNSSLSSEIDRGGEVLPILLGKVSCATHPLKVVRCGNENCGNGRACRKEAQVIDSRLAPMQKSNRHTELIKGVLRTAARFLQLYEDCDFLI